MKPLVAAALLGFVPPAFAQEERGTATAFHEAYPAIAEFFAGRAPALTLLSEIARHPLGNGDTLLVARGAMPDSVRRKLPLGHENRELIVAFAPFVVRGGGVYLSLGLEEAVHADARLAWGWDVVRIEAASERAVTLSQSGDTYGVLYRKITYLLDLDSPAVVARIEHGGLAVGAMATFRDSLYAALSPNRETSTLVAVADSIHPPGLQATAALGITTLDSIEGGILPVVSAASSTPDSLTFYGDSISLIRTAEGWSRRHHPSHSRLAILPDGDSLDLDFLAAPLSPGAIATRVIPWGVDSIRGGAFLVTDEERNRHAGPDTPLGYPAGEQAPEAGVWELAPGHRRLHALPVPTYGSFANLRPKSAQWLEVEFITLEAGIGAFQVVRDTVWFGTTFYDGEGTTGVGAVGSFSLDTRRYDIRHAPALADWSTSALAVVDGVLWLGLVLHPEGASYGGGVLRYDTRSNSTRRYPVPDVITTLVVWEDTVYAGTTDGIYRLQEGRFAPLPLGFDPEGRLIPLEAR